jgi:hypothetical protein
MPDRDPTPADEILERIRPSLSPRKVINPDPVPAVSPRSTPLSRPSSYKKGGIVKKTGPAKLHKGELVLTKKKVQSLKIKLRKKKKPAKKQLAKRTITTQA